MTDALRTLERVGTLMASPTWLELRTELQAAFAQRVQPATGPVAWAELTDADRDLIRRGELEVSAGRSPMLTDPADWGDDAAIEAAVEADDTDALDRALFTVGHGYGERVDWVTGEPALEAGDDGAVNPEAALLAELAADDERKDLPGVDDGDWVGL